MKRALFITGTDTSVGKTFVASALVRALRGRGVDVGVMKPVETGCAESGGRLVPADACALIEAAGSLDPLEEVCPYAFTHPISPHLASRLAGVTIDRARIGEAFDALSSAHDVVVVEGAGGLMVPVSEDATMADVASDLSAPLVIVAANRLGCINHTLLTAAYAESRGLEVAGVVVNNLTPADPADASRTSNATELRALVDADAFAELPHLPGGKAFLYNYPPKTKTPLGEGGFSEPFKEAVEGFLTGLGF